MRYWRLCPSLRGRMTLTAADVSPCSTSAAGQPAPQLQRTRSRLAAEAEAAEEGLQMMAAQGSGWRRFKRGPDCLHSFSADDPGARQATRASCLRVERRWSVR